MAFIFTNHAIERFVQRYAPEMTFAQARRHLEQALSSAVRLREKTVLGQTQWLIASPAAVLVTKQDPGVREAVCVTVLPQAECEDGLSDDGLDGMRAALLAWVGAS